jgi:hypothetical protein
MLFNGSLILSAIILNIIVHYRLQNKLNNTFGC